MKLAPVAPANNKQVNFIKNSHVGKVAIRGVGGFLIEMTPRRGREAAAP
jgi:hypothetical protein